MFDIYMFISFVLMALIFLRQISIFKQPNKINYAPLMLGIGAISSVIHFIISPENQSVIFTLKGSFIPMLIALMLYVVMNIMHQTQVADNERVRMEFTKALIEELSKLKTFTANLEERMARYAEEERELRNEFMFKFNQDIQTLQQLLENQTKFMEKFEEMKKWHTDLTELFINFTEFKLPELDSIIHRHIDMLRVSEAEHYEKLQKYLKATLGDKQEIQSELATIHKEIQQINGMANDLSKQIVDKTIMQISRVTQNFKNELSSLQSYTQALQTSLSEGEHKLQAIKTQSEYVIQQMVLVAQKMEEFEGKKELIDDISAHIMPLFEKVKQIQTEYEQATESLNAIVVQLQKNEEQYLQTLAENTQKSLELLDKKVDDTLDEIKEKYVVATDGISESVKILAKKAKLQHGGYNLDETS